MASKACNRSQPINFSVSPSPDTVFHFPTSPSEPGKFDFYRVHVANHAHHSEPNISDKLNDCTSSTVMPSNSSSTSRRWTPFADVVPSNESNSLTSTSASMSQPISLQKSQTTSSLESSTALNTNVTKNESTQNGYPFFSLTDIVKNALNSGQLATKSSGSLFTGTTLSTKDLNHLSPQSM